MKLNSLTRFFAAAAFVLIAFTACSKQAEAPKVTTTAAVAPQAVASTATTSQAAAPGAAIASTATAPGALPILGPAPKWSLKDVHGQPISSEQFAGKVVVVDFWATWCGPCRTEIPGYADLQRKYGKDGLVVVGVSLDQGGPAIVEEFVKKFSVNYQVVMGDDDIQTAFGGMDAIPTTFLIDRAGNIRDKKIGAEPTEEYEKKVTALLN